MFMLIILTYIEAHCFVTLISLVILLALVYYSNFIRICYYASKLPGPRAYPLPGNIFFTVGKSHKNVGDVLFNCVSLYGRLHKIWLGPIPVFIIAKPDHVQEILSDPDGLEKPWIMTKFAVSITGDSLLTAPVLKWKRNRSKVVKGFTPVILKSYFKVFVDASAFLAEKLHPKLYDLKSFDLFELMAKTSMDTVCRSTMGVNVNAHDANSSYFEAMQGLFAITFSRLYNPWKLINFLFHFTKQSKQLIDYNAIIQGLASEIIHEKRKTYGQSTTNNSHKNDAQKPLLNYLLDITVNDETMTDEQLRDEIILIIVAGFEATATALSYTLLSLAKHKNIQEKVCEELFTLLGDRTVEVDDLQHLKYTEMVIKEAMRLYAPIPMVARELTRDFKFDECIIPKGSICVIPICAYHRDDQIWQNPLEFDPERFTPVNVKNRHPYAYIPFSGGPRNCLGIRYAWMFMKVVMATLLRQYEFHSDLNFDKFKYQPKLSLRLVGGHQVRITPRLKN